MVAISDKVFGKKSEEYLERVRKEGEIVFISEEEEEEDTVVLLSQGKYRELLRKINNLEFEAHLNISRLQLAEGKVVVKTMEELEAMANG